MSLLRRGSLFSKGEHLRIVLGDCLGHDGRPVAAPARAILHISVQGYGRHLQNVTIHMHPGQQV